MFTSQNKQEIPGLIAKEITLNKKTAIKIHYGRTSKPESYLDPKFYFSEIKTPIDFIDSNTLYSGERGSTKEHLAVALTHGFKSAKILSEDTIKIAKHISISKDLLAYEQIIEVAHFSGHKIATIGGCIKNIGMGMASKQTKLWVHNGMAPEINYNKCVDCGWCKINCEYLNNRNYVGRCQKACGACIGNCKAVSFTFGKRKEVILRLVYTAYQITKYLSERIEFKHICIGEDPDRLCDCMGSSREIIQKGFLAVAGDSPELVDLELVKFFHGGLFTFYPKDLIVGQINYYKKLAVTI